MPEQNGKMECPELEYSPFAEFAGSQPSPRSFLRGLPSIASSKAMSIALSSHFDRPSESSHASEVSRGVAIVGGEIAGFKSGKVRWLGSCGDNFALKELRVMATRALRLLRRPLYSSLCRSLSSSIPSSSSSAVSSSRVCSPFGVASQRETLLHLPRAASSASPSRHFASSPGEASGVVEVMNSDEYKSLLNEAKEDKKPAVVYFTAKWCGPCRHISPVVNALSKEFGDVKFLKVDLDEPELQKTIEMAGIAAVPTFQFHLDGKMVSGFSGADAKKLRDTVQELLEETKA